MSRSYWDTPLLPFINMDHVHLKRSRSTDALDRSSKRSKPTDSPKSEPTYDPATSLYPMHTHPLQSPPPPQPPMLKSICISTRTEGPVQQATHRPLTSYENINGILNSVHIERFGDPEVRESWWQQQQQQQQQQQDTEMTDDTSNTEYSSMNSVLRQAFLHRRQS
ncbi:hypothetical protein MFLAVUS_005061 [Mucor flavus]|uniref:Uncharacterized protein n=1 Tax=Mucor flavus TaxID=439312 RepID=A0ABP9YXN7_9FUNG